MKSIQVKLSADTHSILAYIKERYSLKSKGLAIEWLAKKFEEESK